MTPRPETKNTWARDDPAILILLAACLTGSPRLIWQFEVLIDSMLQYLRLLGQWSTRMVRYKPYSSRSL